MIMPLLDDSVASTEDEERRVEFAIGMLIVVMSVILAPAAQSNGNWA